MNNLYKSPFSDRYGSHEMRKIFSDLHKYSTWRRLWAVLAEGEQKLGINITDEQITELWANVNKIPFDLVREFESETHHDVMAHIKAYAHQCPKAAPIIHLGATSAYVVDNADVKIMHDAAWVLIHRIVSLIDSMAYVAGRHVYTPVLSYTHFQPAQPTTFGKRMCMWMQDLEDDLERLSTEVRDGLRMLGCKGATGTCASFMELFDGNYGKVQELDKFVSNRLGIESVNISGQTYSRKRDYYLFSVLSGLAQSLSKMANDLRLMSGRGEFYEPFGGKQVGSSAMAYKQNPIRCEKVVSLARLVINNTTALADTAANQWLERSLDDSAIRRVIIPQTFLALDEMLATMREVMRGCVIRKDVMLNNLREEIPKLVSEGVLMLAVKRGGDRQELHEIIRQCTALGHDDFVEAVVNHAEFNVTKEEVLRLMDVGKLVGAAPIQANDYLFGFHNGAGQIRVHHD